MPAGEWRRKKYTYLFFPSLNNPNALHLSPYQEALRILMQNTGSSSSSWKLPPKPNSICFHSKPPGLSHRRSILQSTHDRPDWGCQFTGRRNWQKPGQQVHPRCLIFVLWRTAFPSTQGLDSYIFYKSSFLNHFIDENIVMQVFKMCEREIGIFPLSSPFPKLFFFSWI